MQIVDSEIFLSIILCEGRFKTNLWLKYYVVPDQLIIIVWSWESHIIKSMWLCF